MLSEISAPPGWSLLAIVEGIEILDEKGISINSPVSASDSGVD